MTNKEIAFVDHIVQPGMTALEAAKRAGYSQPKVECSRVPTRSDVQAAIAERRARLANKMDEIALQGANLLPDKLADARADDLSKIIHRSIQSANLARGEATIIIDQQQSIDAEMRALVENIVRDCGVTVEQVLADIEAIGIMPASKR